MNKNHEVERVENLMYKGCEPHWHCTHCNDYWPFHCYGKKDLEQMECPARKALEEQEPRVLTLDELRSLDGTDHFVWLEDNGEYDLYDCYAEVTTYQNNVELNTFGREVEFEPDNEEYGKTWRCWSARPTEEQRKAVKWDADD